MAKVVGFRIEVTGTDKQIQALQGLQQEIDTLTTRNRALRKENSQDSAEFQKNTVALKELRAQHREVAKQTKITETTSKQLGNSYNSLTAQNRRLSQALRNIPDPLGKGRVEFEKLAAQMLKNTNTLKTLDGAIGRNQRNVGNYPGALGKATGALGFFAGGAKRAQGALISLSSSLGATLGLFGAVRVVSDATGIITDFEQANANLAAVLGKTQEETKELQEDAIRLGSVTSKTASEVTSLQESFARLGFTQQQILDITEATIAGSEALNGGLSETAELTGAIVNSFNDFETVNAPEIIDALTVSTQRSALNFSKLQTAIPIVAGAANAAGVPFNKLLALLGKLSDAGIDASSSSTALRNIFIESAKQGLNYEQILEQIVASQDKLTAATDEFGKRAAVSASVLAENIQATGELEEAIDNAAGAAQEAADTRLNTLTGRLTLLRSAYEGFILSLDTGQGSFSETAKRAAEVATEVLSLLSGTEASSESLDRQGRALRKTAEEFIALAEFVKSIVLGYVGFRLAIVALSTAQAAGTLVLSAARIGFAALEGGVKAATVQVKAFNVASKANVVGALVALLVTAISSFKAFADGAKDAALAQGVLNDRIREAKELEANVDSIEKAFKLRRKLSKDSLINLQNDLKEEIKSISERAERAREIAKERNGKLLELRKRLATETDELQRTGLQRDIRIEKIRLAGAVKAETGITQAVLDTRADFRKKLAVINKLISDDAIDSSTQEEQTKARKKALENELKERAEADDRRLKAIKDLAALERKLFFESTEISLADKEAALDKELVLIKQNGLLSNAEKLLAEKKLAIELTKLREKDLADKARTEAQKTKEVERQAKEQLKLEKEAAEAREAINRASLDGFIMLSVEVANILAEQRARNNEQEIRELDRQAEDRLARIDNSADAELQRLQNKLDAQLITREEFENRRNEIEADAAREKRVREKQELNARNKVLRKQFNNEKLLAIAQIQILGGIAVARVFAEQPYPASLASAIGVSLATTAQTIAVASRKFQPETLGRGKLVTGPSHSQGGVPALAAGKAVEIEGGEAVINKKSTSAFLPLLSAINQAGGGVKFQNGGLPSPSLSIASQAASAGLDLNLSSFADSIIDGINNKQVIVSEVDITETQTQVQVNEQLGTF